MFTLKDIANVVSLIGTGCGLLSRVPQVIKTYKIIQQLFYVEKQCLLIFLRIVVFYFI